MDVLRAFKIRNCEISKAAQVCAFLKGLIMSGRLKAGEKLPGEGELAVILNVSRVTAREAVMSLVQQGMLHRYVGRGTFVKACDTTPNILWVYGKGMASGEISPYYASSMRHLSRECERKGWKLTPAWIGADDADSIESHLSRRLNDYAGYVFVSTDASHPLLAAIAGKGLPYAHITSSPGASRFVCEDFEQGVRMGIEHLRQVNPAATRIAMICHQLFEKRVRRIAETTFGVALAPVFCRPNQATMAAGIASGREAMCRIIDGDDNWSSLLIMDDVMALGACETMLRAKGKGASDVHVLVNGCGALQIPYAKPVAYLFYDIESEASAAVRILEDQLSGRNPDPSGVYVKFSLIPAGGPMPEAMA